MNEPSDATILASARRALADAAPAEPAPAILAAVRREAALRARHIRLRRALLLVAAAAAAAVAAFVLPSSGPRVEAPPDGVRTALAESGARQETPDEERTLLLVGHVSERLYHNRGAEQILQRRAVEDFAPLSVDAFFAQI